MNPSPAVRCLEISGGLWQGRGDSLVLSFAAPAYLLAALAAAAGLVAAHFIVRRQPRALVLPTARFVPDAPVLTTGWARVPADLALLALRILCVALAGLALAGPFLRGGGGGVARVIIADRSAAIGDSAEVSDSVSSVSAAGDVVIESRASLSAGLIAAVRAASELRDKSDSVELIIVSAFRADGVDAASARVRAEWPGRARLITVAPAVSSGALETPAMETATGEPLAVALQLARTTIRGGSRLITGALSPADSTWVAGRAGGVVIHWPSAAPPAGFLARAKIDLIGGAATARHVVVAPFRRSWQYVPAIGSKPIAWWIDGEVAAAEIAVGRGCVKSVAVPVTGAGDFVLRPDVHAFIGDLAQPCGGARSAAPMPAARRAMLAGSGPLAASSAFEKPTAATSALSRWLLVASLACALLELVARSRRRSSR